MRDNVRSLLGEREKRQGSEKDKPFYEESDHPVARLDFQWSSGVRICVSCAHISRLEFDPNPRLEQLVGHEIIHLDLPGQAYLQIIGKRLSKLYDLLKEDRLVWVRDAFLNEEDSGAGVYVQRLGHVELSDWNVDLEALEGHREELLGKRWFPSSQPPR